MSIASVVTQGYLLPDASIASVVLMGYRNGAAAPVPAPAVEVPRFGGGPFWRRYGYGKWYTGRDDEERPEEAVREIAIEALAQVERPTRTQIDQAARDYRIAVAPIESAAREAVRRIWAEEVKRRKLELEQEEAISILITLM